MKLNKVSFNSPVVGKLVWAEAAKVKSRSRACYFCATAERRAPSSPPSNRTSNQISHLSIAAEKACESHMWFLCLVSSLQLLYPYNEREFPTTRGREGLCCRAGAACSQCAAFFFYRVHRHDRGTPSPLQQHHTHMQTSLLGQNQKSGGVGSSPVGNTT